MAPPRAPQAPGAGEADGVPRDHPVRHRGSSRQPEGHRLRARRRRRDEAGPRPALRVRGIAGAVAAHQPRAVGGPGPEPDDPPHRPARARAHGVRVGRLLGHRRHVRHVALVHGHPRGARWPAGSHRAGLRARWPDHRRRRGARRTRRPIAGRRVAAIDLHGAQRRGEGLQERAEGAVHDVHAPAGGRPQAAALVAAGDARSPRPLRAGLHHLHADRLDRAVGHRHHGGPLPGDIAVRQRVPLAECPPVGGEGQERAGSARGHPARRRHVPHPGRGAW